MTWNEIEKANQRSGRTSRMLVEAVNAHNAGAEVYVVTASHRQTHEIRFFLLTTMGPTHRIHVGMGEEFGLNWETMRVDGAHPNCRFFVDHYAIERRWHELLLALHEWDKHA